MTLQTAFTYARKSLKKNPTNFSSTHARTYLPKGRYAPESKDTEPCKFGSVKAY